MAETIKGGAYKSADGSWHDANGKPLSSKQIQEAEELAAQHAEELKEAEAVAAVNPPAGTVVPPAQPVFATEPTKRKKGKGGD